MEYWDKFTLYYHNYNDSKEWHVGEKFNQLQQCWTFAVENATASAFPVATRLELVDKSCCRELQLISS